MFISSHTTIYFYVKKFIFSNVCISVNRIFECLYMFFGWERRHQLIAYTTGRGIGGHPKCVEQSTEGGDCHASCAHTYLHDLFSCFWQHFCLIVSCFIYSNSTLPLFIKDVFVRNDYFSPTRSTLVVMNKDFFT